MLFSVALNLSLNTFLLILQMGPSSLQTCPILALPFKSLQSRGSAHSFSYSLQEYVVIPLAAVGNVILWQLWLCREISCSPT